MWSNTPASSSPRLSPTRRPSDPSGIWTTSSIHGVVPIFGGHLQFQSVSIRVGDDLENMSRSPRSGGVVVQYPDPELSSPAGSDVVEHPGVVVHGDVSDQTPLRSLGDLDDVFHPRGDP